MNFYEKIVLKNFPEFKDLSEEKLRNYLALSKHSHLSLWMTFKFVDTPIPAVLALLLCIVNYLLLNFWFSNLICYAVPFLTIPLIFIALIIQVNIIYRYEVKKQNRDEIVVWLLEKIKNIWLLDGRVISVKDWLSMKKRARGVYVASRSEKCFGKCYYSTHLLAKTISNPNIKLLWICIDDVYDKLGHAVLAKDGYIYDTNQRKTYSIKEYFEIQNAELFKEYSFQDYINAKHFDNLDWDEFGKWCESRNALRTTH